MSGAKAVGAVCLQLWALLCRALPLPTIRSLIDENRAENRCTVGLAQVKYFCNEAFELSLYGKAIDAYQVGDTAHIVHL